MKQKFIRKLIFLLFISPIILFAQFNTDVIILSGELTEDDIFEKDFGRFDAYELQLEEGGYIEIHLQAEFFPLLTIVAPSNQYELAFPSNNKPELIFDIDIDETGYWYLYVSGDSLDRGKHRIQIDYVLSNTTYLPAEANLCTILNFISAHSKTDFFYFNNKKLNLNKDTWNQLERRIGLCDSVYIEEKKLNTYYHVVFIDSAGRDLFNKISNRVDFCLSANWNKNISGEVEKIIYDEIDGDKIIELNKLNNNKVELIFYSEK